MAMRQPQERAQDLASQARGETHASRLLESDHREFERLFARYEELAGDPDAQRGIFELILRGMSIHAAVEEQVLYPAIAESVPDGERYHREALAEHKAQKEVLARLDQMPADDERFDELVRALFDDVRQHVQEEESTLLPTLEEAAGTQRMLEMGEAMQRIAGSVAPTRPHPNAPNTPPGNVIGGALIGLADRAADVVRQPGSDVDESKRGGLQGS